MNVIPSETNKPGDDEDVGALGQFSAHSAIDVRRVLGDPAETFFGSATPLFADWRADMSDQE